MALRVSQVYVTVLVPLNSAQTVSEPLGLTDTLDLITYYVPAPEAIGFASAADHNFVFRTIVQTFDFASLIGTDIEEFITQYLNFTPRQFADAADSIFSWDGTTLPLKGDAVHDVYTFSIENEIAAADSLLQIHLAADAMGLSSAIVGAFYATAFDSIAFTEIADQGPSEFDRENSQSCVKQHVSFKIGGGPCVEKDYHPFIGSADADGYDEMDPTAPELAETGAIVFTFPAVGPTSTLTLKSPAFGNTDGLQFSLIDRTTRGGERIIFGDPNWPKADIRDFTIENVKLADMEAFVEFVNLSLGQEIGILDWEGRAWRGVIIAPESPITETVTGYTIVIRFQGELS